MAEKIVLSLNETLKRAKERGMPISDHSLRRALRMGMIPHRKIGKKYLIAWTNFEKWMLCADETVSTQSEPQGIIRQLHA